MLRNWKKGNNIYHLSLDNHNGEVFKPRIPESALPDYMEDHKTRRVCFSKSISGSYLAIQSTSDIRDKMYVHIPVNENTRYFAPGNELVYDAEYTREVWVTRPVKLKCIGKISIKHHAKYSHGRPKVYFKWLERYD